jgi:hypothetical protein
MKHFLHAVSLFTVLIVFAAGEASAQGCVAIRAMGGCGSAAGASLFTKGQFQVGANYRYFRSFRHFRGDVEEHERLEQNTEVINWTNQMDLNASYSFSPRFSVNVVVPYSSIVRSSLYEHGREERHTTEAHGLGDLRLGASYWLFDPARHHRGNLSVGLGVKLPTGNSNVQDEFYNQGAEKVTIVKAVDQSIQPGDGGTGFTTEVQGFAQLYKGLGLYGNAFYLFNPQRQNDTKTGNDRPTSQYHAIPDQFLARAGFNYTPSWHGLSIGVGGRFEGVPARDAFGSSDAYRRPGYVISVEPGLSWQGRKASFYITAPYALYRNRVRSVDDIARGINPQTGAEYHGDAAFSDYAINLGAAYRFGGRAATGTAMEAPKWKETGK